MVTRLFLIYYYMQKITLKVFVTCVVAVISTATHAQIVLHEATDVTQTKATLSADFPDGYDTGFQYKYGTLTEIDDFSKLALSSLSDPVQINTSGNAWKGRDVKGWVESKSDLPVGQVSVMKTTVTFTQATTIAFEWSVDSEEGIGVLSFIVDGTTLKEISGAVDFEGVSFNVAAGEHTLKWQYKKTSETNVGLDLGMVRNINLQNTTEGEWITVTPNSSSVRLENLYPGKSYIYRATASQNTHDGVAVKQSAMKEFQTLPVSLETPVVEKYTQTTANIKGRASYGDADVEVGYIFSEKANVGTMGDFAKALLAEDTYGKAISITDHRYWYNSGSDYVYSSSAKGPENITATIYLETASTISFEWYRSGRKYGYFDVDGIRNGTGNSTSWNTFTCQLEPGSHTLKWRTDSDPGTIYLRNVSIPSLEYIHLLGDQTIQEAKAQNDSRIIVLPKNESLEYVKTSLRPNTTYYVQSYMIPLFESELPQTWTETLSDVISFTTANVKAESDASLNVRQASATLQGKIDGGDATIIAAGLQYRDAGGSRWTEYPKEVTASELSQDITRLRPNTTYQYRTYIQAQECDTVFSEVGEFTTLAVEALKPTIVKLAQHQAELQGKVRFGDASIYQRGMQFRKSGETEWEEVEDGGNDSIYNLVKKGLEMGARYETRTYIQPAGCDVIYSDILEFTTLDNYFTGYLSSLGTQTTVDFSATLADMDDDITAEEYGFEYYLDSDGFFENAESFVKSDVIRIPVTPENGQIRTTVTGLTPQYGLRFRAYIKINGEYIYYTGPKDLTWDYAGTDRATINVTVKEMTQTSVTLQLDATQDGDAVVSQIEYAFANSVQDTEEYQVCGNELTINNLTPATTYNLRFRGTVNGRLCPLLLSIGHDYSWYELTTKAVTISATFKDVTQTKATMNVSVNAGDAEVTDLKYRLNYGEFIDCGETVNFSGLRPGTEYTVQFIGKANGKDYYWETHGNTGDPYAFTTKVVSVSAHSSEVEQTSAIVSLSYNCGDATYVSSGVEYGTDAMESTSDGDGEIRLTELMPNTTYYYFAYVETEEGGRVSSEGSFSTSAISCTTQPVSSVSNRSATMNGTIDCDGYSSAEFGFQWKLMEGWNSDPAFTKGVKKEDGSISVALVNGMLEPNTDYQYRAAVRYKGNIYFADNWETFRTESEFVYYPASVYTIYRTDRENNCLVLCGYYVAGSEDVVAQGYEYWSTSSSRAYAAAGDVIQITTDESMQYSLDLKTLVDGNYSVRAFVKTSSGTCIYGETMSFGVQDGTLTAIDDVKGNEISYSVSDHILSIYNAVNMSCYIYNLQGRIVEHRRSMTDCEQFRLAPGNVYIVKLSNGITYKVRI